MVEDAINPATYWQSAPPDVDESRIRYNYLEVRVQLDIEKGDTITVNGVAYYVNDVQPTGRGTTSLYITEKQ